jgi:phosphatidylserine decarboxylase
MILTNAISRVFGKFAQTAFPKFIQNFINKTYVETMGLDMSEFDSYDSYETLNKLFTRELKVQRTIDEGMISPVDAFISKMGKVEDATLFQIKGKSYSLKRLLTNHYADKTQLFEQGDYVNFYLSPKDYHRYHVPFDMQVLSVTHVPGKLYPVNFKYLEKVANLFIENERVIVEAKIEGKIVFLVLVGALNVGKMIVHFESDIHTNAKAGHVKKYTYSDMYLKKGEEFGYFQMGSTIVMIAQKDMLAFDLYEGSKVRYGEKIATIH